MLDLKYLGTQYTVLDYDDGKVKEIVVIDSDDLYTLTRKVRGREHLPRAVTNAVGPFRALVDDPTSVSWYSAHEDDFLLEDAIMLAKKQNNSTVVVEVLPNDGQLHED